MHIFKYRAYVRKMPPRGVMVVDEQSGITYRRE